MSRASNCSASCRSRRVCESSRSAWWISAPSDLHDSAMWLHSAMVRSPSERTQSRMSGSRSTIRACSRAIMSKKLVGSTPAPWSMYIGVARFCASVGGLSRFSHCVQRLPQSSAIPTQSDCCTTYTIASMRLESEVMVFRIRSIRLGRPVNFVVRTSSANMAPAAELMIAWKYASCRGSPCELRPISSTVAPTPTPAP